jgi:hypothetical protein
VRQPLRPRAGGAEFRQVVGRGVDEPHRARLPAGAEKLRRRVIGEGTVDAALDPRGAQRLAAPVGEQAHAVGGIHDGVEVGERAVPRQPCVRVLPDQVRRLDVEGDADDDPERAEADGHPVEVGVLASGVPELAVGRHVLKAGYRGGQDPVPAARAVGSGGGRARDGDVRQRAQVGKRQAPVL